MKIGFTNSDCIICSNLNSKLNVSQNYVLRVLIISNGLAIPLILNNVSICKYQPKNIYKNQILQARKRAQTSSYSKISQTTVTDSHLASDCFFIYYTKDAI